MWYILLTIYAGLIYLVACSIITRTGIDPILKSYAILPMMRLSVLMLVLYIAKIEEVDIFYSRKVRRWELGRNPIEGGILLGIFHISLYVIIGLLFGFGKNPYVITPVSLVLGLSVLVTNLLGIEAFRTYMVRRVVSEKTFTLCIVTVAILAVILRIGWENFFSIDFNDPLITMKFIGEDLIPSITMSLLATYMAFIGGMFSSFSYVVVVEGFEWFSPLLPDPNWMILSFIKTIAPVVAFMVLQSGTVITLSHRTRRKIKARHGGKSPYGWIASSIACLVIVLFSFGYFGVHPLVICSGSMEPTLEVGDVVIIAPVKVDEIKVGDIVEYRSTNMSIVHRVHNIRKVGGHGYQVEFITKGDANDIPDPDPVHPDQIVGKVILVIPKIGWISLFTEKLYRGIMGTSA